MEQCAIIIMISNSLYYITAISKERERERKRHKATQ